MFIFICFSTFPWKSLSYFFSPSNDMLLPLAGCTHSCNRSRFKAFSFFVGSQKFNHKQAVAKKRSKQEEEINHSKIGKERDEEKKWSNETRLQRKLFLVNIQRKKTNLSMMYNYLPTIINKRSFSSLFADVAKLIRESFFFVLIS